MIRYEPDGKLVGLRAGVGRDEPAGPSPQFTFSSRPSDRAAKSDLELQKVWCAILGLK
jgi:hypothetical protein